MKRLWGQQTIMAVFSYVIKLRSMCSSMCSHVQGSPGPPRYLFWCVGWFFHRFRKEQTIYVVSLSLEYVVQNSAGCDSSVCSLHGIYRGSKCHHQHCLRGNVESGGSSCIKLSLVRGTESAQWFFFLLCPVDRNTKCGAACEVCKSSKGNCICWFTSYESLVLQKDITPKSQVQLCVCVAFLAMSFL